MRSSSADAPAGGAAAVGGTADAGDITDGPLLGRWGRLVLATLLVGAALLGPAVGFASAQFGDSATVTISITVAPTDPAPTTPAPTATLPEPAPLP
jgi:hypothetical protein